MKKRSSYLKAKASSKLMQTRQMFLYQRAHLQSLNLDKLLDYSSQHKKKANYSPLVLMKMVPANSYSITC